MLSIVSLICPFISLIWMNRWLLALFALFMQFTLFGWLLASLISLTQISSYRLECERKRA